LLLIKSMNPEQKEKLMARMGEMTEEKKEKDESVLKQVPDEGMKKRKREGEGEMKTKKIREKRGGKEEIALRVEFFDEVEKLNVYDCKLCEVRIGEEGQQMRTPKFFQHFRDQHAQKLLDLIRTDIKYHPRNSEANQICNILLVTSLRNKRNRSKIKTSTPLEDLAASLLKIK
jgi:hypothetical protein